MKELLGEIAKAMVDNPNQVGINEIEGVHTTVLELHVSKEDRGKVIGKHGRNADAIRTLLIGAGKKLRKSVVLEIIDD